MPAFLSPAPLAVGAGCLLAGCGPTAPTYVPDLAGTVTLNGGPYKPAKGERLVLVLQEPKSLSTTEVAVKPDGTFRSAGINGLGVPAAVYTVEVMLFGRPPGGPLFAGREPLAPGAPVGATLKQKLDLTAGGGPFDLDLGQWE